MERARAASGASSATVYRATKKPRAKAKAERDKEIKKAAAAGKSTREIAKKVGVSQKTASRVSQKSHDEKNDSPAPQVAPGSREERPDEPVCCVCGEGFAPGEKMFRRIAIPTDAQGVPFDVFVNPVRRESGTSTDLMVRRSTAVMQVASG